MRQRNRRLQNYTGVLLKMASVSSSSSPLACSKRYRIFAVASGLDATAAWQFNFTEFLPPHPLEVVRVRITFQGIGGMLHVGGIGFFPHPDVSTK